MESGFANLYLSLEKDIKAAVPEIKWIDQELGQLEAEEPPVSWPCLLIDFSGAAYSNLSEMVQWADFNINFRLGFSPYSSANSTAPDVSKMTALGYYELEHKLYKALAGYTADDTIQPLIRVSVVTERREDGYRVREMIYTSAAEDEGARQPVTMTPTMLNIANQITSETE